MNGKDEHWIQSASDTKIDFEHPDPDAFRIEDIALGLSRQPRYGGQGQFFYSVAQHSIYAAALVRPELRIHALLHDAHEAYMGDIPKPLKEMLGIQIGVIEYNMQAAIYDSLELEWPTQSVWDEVFAADRSLLEPESRALFKTNLWTPKGTKPAKVVIEEWNMSYAMDMFLAYYSAIRLRDVNRIYRDAYVNATY